MGEVVNGISLNEIDKILNDYLVFLDFINKSGKYKNVNYDNYINYLNDYVKYLYNNFKDVSKDIFKRINVINNIVNTGIIFDYNEYEKDSVNYVTTISMDILKDEDLFNKFINYSKNLDVFNEASDLDYYFNLEQFVTYLKKCNILLDDKEKDRFKVLKNKYGFKITNNYIDDKLDISKICKSYEKEILSDLNSDEDLLFKIRRIYIKLCESIYFDEDYIVRKNGCNLGVEKSKYNKKIISNKSTRLINKVWPEVFCYLLDKIGVNALVQSEDNHRYVVLNCDGLMLKADAIGLVSSNEEDYYMNDIIRTKCGMKPVGLEPVNPNVNIRIPLGVIDDLINLDNNKKIEDYDKDIELYKANYLDNENISFEDRLSILNDLIKSKETGFTYVNYVYRLINSLFSKDEVMCNYVLLKDNDGYYRVTILVKYNDMYNLLDENGFKQVSLDYIKELINDELLCNLNTNIPGLLDKKREISYGFAS